MAGSGRWAGAGVTVIAVGLLLTSACGYIRVPLAPLANVPSKISDLAAVQRGSTIVAHCTVPTITTENYPLKASVKLDLRIAAAGEHFDAAAWAAQAKEISDPEIKDGLATYKIPTQEWTGKKVAIGVRSVSSKGKESEWSNFEIVPVIAPPETPSKPEVTDTALGEHITWTGRGDQFRVLRRIGDEKDYSIASTVAGHEWTDTGIDYGKPYNYMVQALVDAGNKKTAESDLSDVCTCIPQDKFPPAVPAALRAAPPIQRRWSGSPIARPIWPDTACTAPRAMVRGRNWPKSARCRATPTPPWNTARPTVTPSAPSTRPAMRASAPPRWRS